MDTSPRAHVLLETVATLPQTGGRTAQTGCLAKLCHTNGVEPQELLAHGVHAGNAKRHDQRMAEITRAGFYPRTMDRVSLPGGKSARVSRREGMILPNRRVRTRMHGGVGAGS